MIAHHRGDDEPTRLGLVASRKMGNAVHRNRGKRRVREWFRNYSSDLGAHDLVIVLRASAATIPAVELWRELDRVALRLLKRAELLRGAPSSHKLDAER